MQKTFDGRRRPSPHATALAGKVHILACKPRNVISLDGVAQDKMPAAHIRLINRRSFNSMSVGRTTKNKKCQRRKRSAGESATAASFDIFDRSAGDPPEMPIEEERDHEILVKRCMIMKEVLIAI